jgi:hypothetical protein
MFLKFTFKIYFLFYLRKHLKSLNFRRRRSEEILKLNKLHKYKKKKKLKFSHPEEIRKYSNIKQF